MSTESRISGLVTLILSAVGCAVAITAFMVYQYGPSGSYPVQKSLLNPEFIPALSFNAINSKTGAEDRYVFDNITFTYFSVDAQQPREVGVTYQQYTDFYKVIANEKSMTDVPQDFITLFDRSNPARLSIYIQTESNAQWQQEKKIFQEVQIATEGNFYRIQLRQEENPQHEWAYYHHPDIKEKAFNIFVPKQ